MKPNRERPLYLPFATALRDKLRGGYDRQRLQADLLAGITVGIVAVPLAMALAIGSGAPPQYGLYTAIVAGLLIALTGGSRFSVSGPTAAFIVILHPIAEQYGLGGLVTAGFMAGIMLICMGVARMGKLIQFIPYPVTTGFTTGIAVVIASLQLKDFFGLQLAAQPEHFLERMWLVGQALAAAHTPDLLIGIFTLGLLLIWPRLKTGLPGPLIGMAVADLLAWLLSQWIDGFSVATIASRFSYVQGGETLPGIPPVLPQLVLPWQLPGPDGQPIGLSLGLIKNLLGPAMAIALLGAIESLLCAVVADGMTGTRHDPDAELIGQGIGNALTPFFGGIAATGALARTATNIRAGARSPLAAVFHALFVLLVLLALSPLLGYLPMAALAALLLIVAWNMSEIKHFAHITRIAPRSDILVLLVCFGLTVVFDMVIAISIGVVLASLLFMGRMAALSSGKHVDEVDHPHLESALPDGVRLYAVSGSLFFGAAEKAMRTLHDIGTAPRAVIIDISEVTSMDVSGLVALDSAIERLRGDNILVAIAGVRGQPALLMRRAGLHNKPGKLLLSASLPQALLRVRHYLE